MSNPENHLEENYTAYVKSLSAVRASVLSLLSGFTFSAIGVFLNQMPDPHNLISQTTLLFISFLFDLFLFLLAWQLIMMVGLAPRGIAYSKIERINKEMRTQGFFNWVMFLGFGLWGYTVVLMFMLWDLTYLAIISGVTWTLIIFLLYTITSRLIKRLQLSSQ
jgi:hypothetical protein